MAIEKKFVREQVNRLLIKEFLQKETERAGFGGLDIQRTPMGTRVSLTVERPGMVIGRRGATIQKLTSDLSSEFDAENPQIEVVEAGRNANLNANIMAAKVAEALERGWHFRRAGHSTVRRIMESGAKGCIVILSGKLTGQRHRVEKFIAGHIKYNGDTAIQLMDIGYAQCKKKLGTIGCTVKIMHPDARLPDEVNIFAPGEKELAERAPARPETTEETPAAAEGEAPAEGEAAASGEAATEAPAEERPKRPRRREPQPQPTEADLAEAKALAESRKAAKKGADTEVHVTKGEAPNEGPGVDAPEPPAIPDAEVTPAEPAAEPEGALAAEAEETPPAKEEKEAPKAAKPKKAVKKTAKKAVKKTTKAKPEAPAEPADGPAASEEATEPATEAGADAKADAEAPAADDTKDGDA